MQKMCNAWHSALPEPVLPMTCSVWYGAVFANSTDIGDGHPMHNFVLCGVQSHQVANNKLMSILKCRVIVHCSCVAAAIQQVPTSVC